MKKLNKKEQSCFKIIGETQTISSLLVANFLNKSHGHILKSIRNICNEGYTRHFTPDLYVSNVYKGRDYPLFFMDISGFDMLAVALKLPKDSRIIGYVHMRFLPQHKPDTGINKQVIQKITYGRALYSEQQINIGLVRKILNLPYEADVFFENLQLAGLFNSPYDPAQEFIDDGYFRVSREWSESNLYGGFTITKITVSNAGLDLIHKSLSNMDKPTLWNT